MIESTDDTRLMDNFYSLFEQKLHNYLESYEFYIKNDEIELFILMFELINGTKFMSKNFPEIKKTDLRNEFSIRKWKSKYLEKTHF